MCEINFWWLSDTKDIKMAQGKVVHPEKIMPFVVPGCEGKYLSRMLIDIYNCGSEKLQVNHGTVKAGQALAGSAHEGHDELYIALKGHADLNLCGEHYELKPGSTVFIPGGTFHALSNKSNTEDFELITIWPGQPKPGVNEVYDMRKQAWGTTYREV